ncbi:MAG: HEAT repeat domain-containing protein [Gemmatimonadetes bacterium]|nr:HEAT repeat domain-containing protein [Gemmatimonadota bacterium]MBT4611679.1 HEAT repeat domain-containing protein [Gemmatimonadota bacterium]MBT5056997.1 HEAT repeat domain-containing protein [Gemmatimonadota bacterium]MBT5142250.1 HEAT repeat domain-containing protein [Gemmatimonadota bacterium]MBT5589165.1 HEAT repeat domain-containing protein [Gemmatimonadota bacterium]
MTILLLLVACEESPEELVVRLASRDPNELRQVSDRLLRQQEDVIPALRGGLQSDRWRTRFMSAQLLGTLRAKVAVADLLVALSDSNVGVVERSVTALGQIGDPAAAHLLGRRLQHPSIDVALAAAIALEQVASTLAMEPLLAHMHDPSPRLRVQVMQAMGACIDTTHVLADSVYRLLANELAAPSPTQQVAAIAGLRGFAYRGLAPWLLNAIERESPEVVYVAVQALGEIKGDDHPAWTGHEGTQQDIVAALSRVASDPGLEAIRVKAALSLGQLEASSAIPLLEELKANQGGDLRLAAARALRVIAGEGW